MNIGIYIYKNAEVLDFSGPFEVFSTALRLSPLAGISKVFLVAEKHRPVIARGGYSVNPHYSFNDHPAIDLLIVVGGIHTEEMKKPAVIDWIRKASPKAQLIASVCTGAFLLAEAKLLSSLEVTTHWEDIDMLRNAYSDITVIENKRWVDTGRIVTSGGISAGIDMSLHLVSRITSLELAESTATQMEFDWQRTN